MGKKWKEWQTIFLGSNITADDDCSHEIKGHLLLGRKAIVNLDSILKSRAITLPTEVCIVKVMVFPVVMYGCKSGTTKKAEHWTNDAFELWCWRRLLRVPWKARRSNQSILKEINPEYSLEGLMLKLWLQRANSLEKTLILGKTEGRRKRAQQRMAPSTQWTWVLTNSRRSWRTGKPCMLQSTGSQWDTTEQLNNKWQRKRIRFKANKIHAKIVKWYHMASIF